MLQVAPDWQRYGPKQELERYVNRMMTITGPGFYLTDTDTVLILRNSFSDSFEPDDSSDDSTDVYVLHCYNVPFERTIFAAASLIPVRRDSRSNRP